MKVDEDGHIYHLAHVDGEGYETSVFIKRSGGAITHDVEHPGTNLQEHYRMLIDRIWYLHEIIPAVENLDLIFYNRMALLCLEGRAYRRKIAKLNREKPEHTNYELRDRDLPFDVLGYIDDDPKDRVGIERLPVGPDGHILLKENDQALARYSEWSSHPSVRSKVLYVPKTPIEAWPEHSFGFHTADAPPPEVDAPDL